MFSRADAPVLFALVLGSLCVATDQANQAIKDFTISMNPLIEGSLEALTVEQRFLYEQLIAAGALKLDALEEAENYQPER